VDAPYDVFDLTGRTAIVTGGGTGIGRATALLLARFGADVAIAARTVADLEETAAMVTESTGRRCLVLPTDVKQEDQVVAMVRSTVDELGGVDILVNNAGGTRMAPLAEIPMRAWDSSYELNVRSAYIATREAGVHMREKSRGSIVNISSGAGVHGVKGGAHYSSSKAALQMFTTVTAAEWGRFGIRANCIAVGGIASERSVAAWEVAGIDQSLLASGTPIGRVGQPIEVARMIHFFASDASSYVSGQTISVDGGPSLGGIPDA
jgi:NAD(P)-dependent dehydrogenase (short-subunit alcohol dehydrogenase family)